MDKLKSRTIACIRNVFVGDALGAPWENYTFEQIRQETNGRGVTGFTEPKNPRTDLLNYVLGNLTDDSRLSADIAESLIRRGRYDLTDIAMAHLSTARKYTSRLGLGKTTKAAFADWSQYFGSCGKSGRPPSDALPMISGPTGAGNGVAIKIAPLALWHAIRCKKNDNLFAEISEIGAATHPNPLARLSAYVFAELLKDVFDVSLRSETDKLRKLRYIKTCLAKHALIARIEIKEAVQILDEKFVMIAENLKDPDALRREVGVSGYAPESVMFAIATFLRHPTDCRAAMLEAVNAGGDTDSIASMVGALVGANCGLEDEKGKPTIPAEWMAVNPEFQEAISLGERLYIAAQNS